MSSNKLEKLLHLVGLIYLNCMMMHGLATFKYTGLTLTNFVRNIFYIFTCIEICLDLHQITVIFYF